MCCIQVVEAVELDAVDDIEDYFSGVVMDSISIEGRAKRVLQR